MAETATQKYRNHRTASNVSYELKVRQLTALLQTTHMIKLILL